MSSKSTVFWAEIRINVIGDKNRINTPQAGYWKDKAWI
jgi:hypothetical protein